MELFPVYLAASVPLPQRIHRRIMAVPAAVIHASPIRSEEEEEEKARDQRRQDDPKEHEPKSETKKRHSEMGREKDRVP